MAYSTAASFRYSHYFVSFLSQFGTIIAGIGHKIKDSHYSWYELLCSGKFCMVQIFVVLWIDQLPQK